MRSLPAMKSPEAKASGYLSDKPHAGGAPPLEQIAVCRPSITTKAHLRGLPHEKGWPLSIARGFSLRATAGFAPQMAQPINIIRCIFSIGLSALLCACPPGPSSNIDPSKTLLDAAATDPTHVRIVFDIENDLDVTTASNPDNYELANYLVDPPDILSILSVESVDAKEVLLETSTQVALATYTVKVTNIKDNKGNLVADQATTNVVGVGDVPRADVTFSADANGHVPLISPILFVTVNPDTGVFSEQLRQIPMSDPDQDGIFTATLQVAIDPRRTVDPLDDRLGPDRRAYAALIKTQGQPASELTPFQIVDANAATVPIALTTDLIDNTPDEICDNTIDDDLDTVADCADSDCASAANCQNNNEEPLVAPPNDPIPGDGFTLIRIAIDDRAAKALVSPAIKVSVNAQGIFDASLTRIINVADPDGDRIFTADVNVKVDPNRVIGGNTAATFPFVTFLREGNVDFEGITNAFTVPNETPKTVNLHVGNPNLVPVTFRVDASQAFLNATGTQRGVLPGESVFLTGEFAIAEDAFGRNAADAFSGGENINLEMVERQDVPGVWEKTIFLPGNRPFGWKVVRCPATVGCTQLNQFVSSAGRAFPTVMKNLVTENEDASGAGSTSVIINPKALNQVQLKDGTIHNYSNATVFDGQRGDPTPPAPADNIMFKQEVPDLVVIVGEAPVKTPIFVVGTWRDINLPFTPQEIIQNGQTVNLTDFDYDDGFIGFFPPERPDDLPNNDPENCTNGVDDDNDNQIDCADTQCAANQACQNQTPEDCDNGVDDDGDNQADCNDPQCSQDPACAPVAQCPANPPAAPNLTFTMDGQLDASARLVGGGVTSVRLLVAFSGDGKLYVATDDAGEGSDHFFFLSATPPGAANFHAPFGKQGNVSVGTGDMLFLADENDNGFSGWFKLNAVSADTLLSGGSFVTATGNNGGVVEGVVDLAAAFGAVPAQVFIAAGPYLSADNTALISQAQTPSGDSDGDIDATEFVEVCIPGLEVVQ